ncbi:MAG: hypothetical protein MUE71_07545 [Chitinophagaceae bacterium]|nr:hypothetical protein [Chitinophagaceae bacterium]
MKYNHKHMNKDAERWADDALNSLDGMSRATANPFLYTKIVARIEANAGGWENAARLISRPAFALASLAIFLVINIAVIVKGQQKAENELAQKLNSEQMLASEFMNTQNYQLVEIND